MKKPLAVLIFNFAFASCQISKIEAMIAGDILSHLQYNHITIAHPTIPTDHSLKWEKDAVRVISQAGLAVNFLPVDELYTKITGVSYLTHLTAIIARTSTFQKCFYIYDEPIRFMTLGDSYLRWTIRNRYGWLVFMDGKNGFISNNLIIPFGVQVFLVEPLDRAEFLIWEQYHVNNDSLKKLYAKWSSLSGLVVSDLRPIYQRRSFAGATLRKHSESPEDKGGNLKYLCDEAIDSFSMIFQFRVEEVVATVETDDFDLTDLSILLFDKTPNLETYFGPIGYQKINLYYQGLGDSSEANYIIRPFTPQLWQFLGYWILVAVVCSAAVRFNSKRCPTVLLPRAFAVLEAFCNQDSDETNIDGGYAERLVTAFVWGMVFFIVPAYNSDIFSFMIIKNAHVPFEDLKGFINEGNYKYGAIPLTTGRNIHLFLDPKSPIVEAAAKYMIDDEILTIDEGIQKMCKDKHFAFLSYGNAIQHMPSPCRIDQMKEPYYTATYLSYTQRGFPFGLAFKEKLPLIYSSGIQSVVQERSSETVLDTPTDEPQPVDVTLITALLLIMPSAVILSVLILFIELICHHYTYVTWKLTSWLPQFRRKIDTL